MDIKDIMEFQSTTSRKILDAAITLREMLDARDKEMATLTGQVERSLGFISKAIMRNAASGKEIKDLMEIAELLMGDIPIQLGYTPEKMAKAKSDMIAECESQKRKAGGAA